MRVFISEQKWIAVRKAAKERISKCQTQGLCVACMEPIGDKRSIRGCCMACYYATYRAIRTGRFTEEERVKNGKLLEKSEAGRKPSNPVSIEASN